MKHGWEIKKLGDVCDVAAGQGAPQGEANYCLDGTPFIKAGNLEDLINGLPEYDVQKVSEDVAKQHRLKLYKAGSVVFAKSGMSCMKGYVYSLKTDCYVVSHLAILTPFDISTIFLKYTLGCFCPNTLVKDTAYPSISLEDIKAFNIPVPPIAEQERIVAELDCLSSVIEKQKKQLKELDNLAQSIFYTMFGDPISNNFGWEVKKLGDICESKKKIARASKCYLKTDIIHYIDISSIDNKVKVITEPTPYTFGEAPSRAQQVVKTGDILVSLVRPNLQNVAMITLQDDKLVASSGFCVLRVGAKSNTRFVKHLAISERFTTYLMERVSGANYPAVREDDIRDCTIGVPPLSLQQEFASKIEAIEKQKELIKKSIAETETLFNSRMDYYFN